MKAGALHLVEFHDSLISEITDGYDDDEDGTQK